MHRIFKQTERNSGQERVLKKIMVQQKEERSY